MLIPIGSEHQTGGHHNTHTHPATRSLARSLLLNPHQCAAPTHLRRLLLCAVVHPPCPPPLFLQLPQVLVALTLCLLARCLGRQELQGGEIWERWLAAGGGCGSGWSNRAGILTDSHVNQAPCCYTRAPNATFTNQPTTPSHHPPTAPPATSVTQRNASPRPATLSHQHNSNNTTTQLSCTLARLPLQAVPEDQHMLSNTKTTHPPSYQNFNHVNQSPLPAPLLALPPAAP